MNTNYGSRKAPPKEIDAIANELHQATRGFLNVSFYFEPDDAVVTQTTIYHPSIGWNSFIALYPITAAAAAIVATTWEDRAQRTQGSAVIIHPASDPNDVQFMGIIIGS